MNIDYKLIGARIKSARKNKGITQGVLAENLDVSVGYISQVERGTTKISLDLLGAISYILDCDISHFITESSTKCDNYIANELMQEINKLDNKKRTLLLSFIKLISEL